MISENDLRWFAARLLIAMEDTRKYGGMGVHELKQALRDIPGVESLTLVNLPNGNQRVTIAGQSVDVSPTASNAEITLAFQHPNVTITPLPAPVAYMPAPTTRTTAMSITGAAPAALSIKDLIANSRQTVKAAHDKLIANAGKVNDAAAALNGLGDDLGKEGDDLMAMIGQFKNDLGGTSA